MPCPSRTCALGVSSKATYYSSSACYLKSFWQPWVKVVRNNFREKVLIRAWENKLQKPYISQNEILCIMILPVVSQFLWNLIFIFSGSHIRTFSLESCHITYHIHSPWKVSKRIQYGLKYSGTMFLSTEN